MSGLNQTNEEIIDELTKELGSISTEAKDNIAASSSATNNITETNNISDHSEETNHVPEDFDKSDDESQEKSGNTLPDDYIDEEALKVVDDTLSDEEKEERRKQCVELKNRGNEEFKNGEYMESLNTYTEALRLCPLKYTDERSKLYSNRAASKMKLGRVETAIDDCTSAITLNPNFVRALLRRAKLYEGKDKLDEALEDFKKILELDPGVHDARAATVRLPPLITERNEKLKTEMLGKLKDLGNMFLRPFGLSTENFQLNQDPNSGGYSVNFQQQKPK